MYMMSSQNVDKSGKEQILPRRIVSFTVLMKYTSNENINRNNLEDLRVTV